MRVIVRERLPRLDPRLGRSVLHDSESLRYAYRARRNVPLIAVRHRRYVPIFDQGSLGSCTGEAGVGCLSTGLFYDTIPPGPRYTLNQAGAVHLYSDATAADPYPGQWPPNDTGSDGLTVAKMLTAAIEISGYLHALTIDDALGALQLQPIITGIPWFDGMFTPDAQGRVRPTGSLAGGHEIVADEYDPARGWVGFTNSWSESWGPIGGRFYLTVADWADLLAQDGDVTVFVPRTAPAPVPTPVPPVNDPADDTLARALPRGWSTGRHVGDTAKAAKAVAAWQKAKGYR